jgi:hypothetical protein
MVDKFYEHEKYACIYYAYNTIHKYLVSFLTNYWMLKHTKFVMTVNIFQHEKYTCIFYA